MSEAYFSELNYTLANEDTSLELAILPEKAKHVVAVAGSGARVLPLLARHPRKLTCVDLSAPQLHLTELRMSAARALTHAEYLGFWGYPPRASEPAERRRIFDDLELSAPARDYFRGVFDRLGWQSVLYEGRWERTFARLARINRLFTRTAGTGLFSALSDAEHADYMKRRFPHRAWSATILLMANAGTFNALLYKGSFPKKNLQESYFRHYTDAFERLFAAGPARRNFFLQIIFFGKVIFPEGCPIECDSQVFARARACLKTTRVEYVQADLVEHLRGMRNEVDFLSFSDVPSYFQGEQERRYLQAVRPALKRGGLTVVRNYLHLPQGLDETGFARVTARYRDAIAQEKVQVYHVDVFEAV